MNRYENGKIYRLQFPDDSFYVGSTCLELSKRLYWHKCSHYKCSSPLYLKWREVGRNAVEIFLIETFACNSKNELEARENTIILQHKDNDLCLNKKRAIASPNYDKEYRERNKELLKQNRRIRNALKKSLATVD
jgi:hypothetical protein